MQHDYTIANQGFPATRADINNALSAIATNNSGTSAPSTQYAGQFWIDTTSSTWTLYIHDGTDDIQFATIDTSANTVNFTDSALDVVTDTTPQLGGDLDLNSNDITGTGNINITGSLTASGNLTSLGIDDNATSTAITIDSSENVGIGTSSPETNLHIEDSSSFSIIRLVGSASDNVGVDFGDPDDRDIGRVRYNNSDNSMVFHTNASERMRINSNGSILYSQGTYAYTERIDNIAVSPGGTVTLFNLYNGEEGKGQYLVSVTRTGGGVATRAIAIVASSSASLTIVYGVLDSNGITIGASGTNVTATYTGGSNIDIRATAIPLVIQGN